MLVPRSLIPATQLVAGSLAAGDLAAAAEAPLSALLIHTGDNFGSPKVPTG